MGRLLELLGGPVTSLVGAVGSVIDDLKLSGEEKLEAQRQLLEIEQSFQRDILQADVQLAQTQAEVLKAEIASESPWARNWRPTLMYVCIFIVAYNFAVAPMFGLQSEPMPERLWDLLVMGVGGYMSFRTIEKVLPNSKWGRSPQ